MASNQVLPYVIQAQRANPVYEEKKFIHEDGSLMTPNHPLKEAPTASTLLY
jgi:hypothetical protein